MTGSSAEVGSAGMGVSAGGSETGTVGSSGGTFGSSLVSVTGGFSAQALIDGEPIESASASVPAAMAAPRMPTLSSEPRRYSVMVMAAKPAIPSAVAEAIRNANWSRL